VAGLAELSALFSRPLRRGAQATRLVSDAA
jgi:hypothetical protein